MNLLLYLPPVFSIYLLLISGVSSGYIKSRLRQFIDSYDRPKELSEAPNDKPKELTGDMTPPLPEEKQSIESHKELKYHALLIENITLDWAAKLGFFNSMFAAMISALSIWSKTGNQLFTSLTIVLLLAIFVPMMWWILGHDVDELVSTIFRRWHITHSRLCQFVLIFVNLILILAIMYSEKLSAPTTPPTK